MIIYFQILFYGKIKKLKIYFNFIPYLYSIYELLFIIYVQQSIELNMKTNFVAL